MTEHHVDLEAIEKSYSEGDHSIFSPSGSSMWANCPGSLLPNLKAKDTAGVDAATGTVAHGIAERWLKTGEKPSHLVGTIEKIGEFEIEIDASMMEYVEQYVQWCDCLPGTHYIETKVDFSDLTPVKNQRGTADHAACEYQKLTITDLKFGQGVQVYAEDNTQGLLYAYGFFLEHDWLYDFQTITIRICQPRKQHFDDWTITRDELLAWAAKLKKAAYAAWCKDAERIPGEKQCQWCKIKPDCAAFAVFAERLIDGVFDDLTEGITADAMESLAARLDAGEFSPSPTPVGTLTVPQKAALLPFRSMIESWFKDIAGDLERRCINGEDVPGYKLVLGKSNRVFSNKDEAIETLEFLGLDDEVIRPRGMITPAQAEKELIIIGFRRKELPGLLNRVVTKPQGKPSMVPISDKRPSTTAVVDGVFDNVDESI